MFMILLLLAVVAVVGYFAKKQFEYQVFARRGIPGPTALYPFGNTRSWVLGKRNFVYDIDDVYRQFKGKAPFVSFFVTSTPYLLLTDADLIKQIIIKDFKQFRNNDFVVDAKKDPILSRNPFWLKDDLWKEKRIDLAPAMTPAKLKAIYPLVLNGTKSLVEYLKSQTGDVDSRDAFARYTCDSVISCIYGLDAQSFLSEEPYMYKRGQEFLDGIKQSAMAFSSRDKVVSSQTHDFFIDVASDSIKIREEAKVVRDDFLSHFLSLRDKKGTTHLDIAADCATVFLDGYETTALALHYAFYELGRNQTAQEKLRKEILENTNAGEDISFEKLLELPFLDQCFHEALRLYSPVLYSTKISSEKMEMRGAEGRPVLISPGDTFWIPLYSIHRDPEYYPNPNRFFPERFNPEFGGVKAFKDRCVLLPFGDGPRICVGMRFAFVQVKAAIAEVVSKFKVTASDRTPVNFAIGADQFLSKPECKLMLKFESI